jgi:Protein of unknown function (DUF1579)
MALSRSINPLLMLVGDWRGHETIEPSKWGPGGTAAATVSCREELGGRAFVQTYAAERDGRPWLQAHAVFTCDPADNGCSLFWFDSLGFVPGQPAPGQWDGEALSFVRSSPRGRTRQMYLPQGDDAYAMRLETSFDDGASWVPVMTGHYIRVE